MASASGVDNDGHRPTENTRRPTAEVMVFVIVEGERRPGRHHVYYHSTHVTGWSCRRYPNADQHTGLNCANLVSCLLMISPRSRTVSAVDDDRIVMLWMVTLSVGQYLGRLAGLEFYTNILVYITYSLS